MTPHSSEPGVEERIVADAIYAVAFSMLDAERWSCAADVFRAMLLACPGDERAWVGLGRCHEELAQQEVAAEIYALGARALPLGVRCLIALSRALRELGRADEADVALEAAEAAAAVAEDESSVALVAKERVAS